LESDARVRQTLFHTELIFRLASPLTEFRLLNVAGKPFSRQRKKVFSECRNGTFCPLRNPTTLDAPIYNVFERRSNSASAGFTAPVALGNKQYG
jgi:hypothetical protein